MELRTVLTGKTIPIHKDPLVTPSNGTDIDDFGVCWLLLAVAGRCDRLPHIVSRRSRALMILKA